MERANRLIAGAVFEVVMDRRTVDGQERIQSLPPQRHLGRCGSMMIRISGKPRTKVWQNRVWTSLGSVQGSNNPQGRPQASNLGL